MAPGYEIADRSNTGHEAQEEFVRSPPEPEELFQHDGPPPRQNRAPPSQIGPVHFTDWRMTLTLSFLRCT